MIISTVMACAILISSFIRLVLILMPVAFPTLSIAVLDVRLTPFSGMDRMFQSYNSYIFLEVPIFLLTDMNSVRNSSVRAAHVMVSLELEQGARVMAIRYP